MRLADTGSAKTDGRQSQIEFTYYLLPQRISTETYFQNRKVMTRLFQEEDLWEAFLLDLEGGHDDGRGGGKIPGGHFLSGLSPGSAPAQADVA